MQTNIILSIVNACKDLPVTGGFSIPLNGSELPHYGYVASVKGSEWRVSRLSDNTLNLSAVWAYIGCNSEALSHDDAILGAWCDNDFVYLDSSRFFFVSDDAETFARQNEQLAYFDIQTKQSVYLAAQS